MLKIAIVGPESSGKTTLVEGLSERSRIGHVREMAREYLEGAVGPYAIDDLITIARLQVAMERAALKELTSEDPQLILCDTDMITIAIWSQEKFGSVHPELEELVSKVHYDLWLLCRPDMPWEADPLREDPDDRDRLFEVYERTLRDLDRPYSILHGPHEERMHRAQELIDRLMDRSKSIENR